jgi:hypothetical protein
MTIMLSSLAKGVPPACQAQCLQNIDAWIHHERARFGHLSDHIGDVACDISNPDRDHRVRDVFSKLRLDFLPYFGRGPSCRRDFTCQRERKLSIRRYDDNRPLHVGLFPDRYVQLIARM